MQRGVGRGLARTKPAWMTTGVLGGLSEDGNRNGSSAKRRRSPSRSDSRSRSGSTNRRRGRHGGGREAVGAGRSRGRSRSRTRSRSRSKRRSRSRSPVGGRRDRWSGAANGARSHGGRLDQSKSLPGSGGGRGRGATLPAWMTEAGRTPGGLQQQNGERTPRKRRSPSPAKFALRSSVPASPAPPYHNGGGGGAGGRYGGGGGVRGIFGGGSRQHGGRGSGRGPEPLPPVFSVHKGEVVKTETFGAFVKLDGYRKHGLVHCSQMASYRVEDVTDVCKVGDTVYVKAHSMATTEPPEWLVEMYYVLSEGVDKTRQELQHEIRRRKSEVEELQQAIYRLAASANTHSANATVTKAGGSANGTQERNVGSRGATEASDNKKKCKAAKSKRSKGECPETPAAKAKGKQHLKTHATTDKGRTRAHRTKATAAGRGRTATSDSTPTCLLPGVSAARQKALDRAMSLLG